MTAQVSKFTAAVVGKPKPTLALHAVHVQVLAQATGKWPGALPPSDLRVPKFTTVVVGQPKESQEINLLDAQVLAEATGTWPLPGDVSRLQLSKLTTVVVGQPKESQEINLLDAQVLAEATGTWPLPGDVSRLQLSKLTTVVVGRPIPSSEINLLDAQVLGKGLLPPSPIPLPVVLDVLRHNWIEQVQLTTTWATDVSQSALRLSEERRGLLARPYRMIEFLWTGAAQGASTRALMALARIAEARFVLPLYSDVSRVTAASSGTLLSCQTDSRRFQVGGFVVVFEQGPDCEPTNIQIRELTAIGSGTLTFSSGLTGTIPEGAAVLPLLYCEVSRSGQVNYLSDHFSNIPFVVEEVTGPTALLPLATGVGGATLFEGDPVFPFPANWESEQGVGIYRPGLTEVLGRGTSIFLRGERPLFKFDLVLRGMNRAEVFQIASFFDSRRGRLLPFWIPNPSAMFKVVTWSLAQVDVEPMGPFANLTDFISCFAVVMDSGQVILRRASAVLDLGATWRIGFVTPLPAEAANFNSSVTRFTTAHFVRFSSDSLTEEWTTNAVATLAVSCEEILEEQDIILNVNAVEEVIEIPLNETPRDPQLDGKLWLSAHLNDAATYLTQVANKVSAWADKYGVHGGVSQAAPLLQPTYDATAFGNRGGVIFDGSLGEFLEGVAPLTQTPFFVMGVLSLDTETEEATVFKLYNSGAPGDYVGMFLTGTNVVVPQTTDPALRVESNSTGFGVLGGDTLGLNPDYSPGDKAYETDVPFGALLTAFDDVNQVPFQRNIFGRIRNPTTGTNNTLFGGRGFASATTFPNPAGIDTLRIGLDTLGLPNSRLTIGELIFFNYQSSQAALQGTDFLTNLMFDYFSARWPIQ